MERKQSKDWYLAATHFLTSGFVVPFLFGLIIGIPLVVILGEKNLLFTVIVSIIRMVAIWLGVIYSARYINKKYLVKDKDKIVKFSAMYFIILGIFGLILELAQGILPVEFFIDLISFILQSAIFYKFSKKYIINTSLVQTEQIVAA